MAEKPKTTAYDTRSGCSLKARRILAGAEQFQLVALSVLSGFYDLPMQLDASLPGIVWYRKSPCSDDFSRQVGKVQTQCRYCRRVRTFSHQGHFHIKQVVVFLMWRHAQLLNMPFAFMAAR